LEDSIDADIAAFRRGRPMFAVLRVLRLPDHIRSRSESVRRAIHRLLPAIGFRARIRPHVAVNRQLGRARFLAAPRNSEKCKRVIFLAVRVDAEVVVVAVRRVNDLIADEKAVIRRPVAGHLGIDFHAALAGIRALDFAARIPVAQERRELLDFGGRFLRLRRKQVRMRTGSSKRAQNNRQDFKFHKMSPLRRRELKSAANLHHLAVIGTAGVLTGILRKRANQGHRSSADHLDGKLSVSDIERRVHVLPLPAFAVVRCRQRSRRYPTPLMHLGA